MNGIVRKISLLLATLVLLLACSQNEQQQLLRQAVAIESADECHLCGMIISHFNGPKGELYRKEPGSQVVKFCSTRDLFSYYLDPENQRNVEQLLVHDMSKMPWHQTDDRYFIDAQTAWFVDGATKMGSMGKTLASFSLQADAQAFANEFGGRVITFKEIDLAMLR